MDNNSLEISASIQISKPAKEVFEAIVDPEKMRHYFIAKSSGRMEAGKNLVWQFPEFDDKVPLTVGKIEADEYVSFKWEGSKGKDLLVEIKLIPKGESTLVRIGEKGMPNDAAGIAWLKSNTEGWANFLACLKAYLEHGINLREGAFDFMKQ